MSATGLDAGRAREVLDQVRDPCLGAAGMELSIVDLGLVRDVEVDEDGAARVAITFTEPGCMFTHRIIAEVQDALTAAGATSVEVTPAWLPLWRDDRLSPRAARALGDARRRYGEELRPSFLRTTPSRMDAGRAAVPEGGVEPGAVA